jgi:transcription-repair coupling factor (superfamily II helicase)
MRINSTRASPSSPSEEEVDALYDEVENRFGSPPLQVERLLTLAALTQQARSLGVARVDAGPQAIALTLRGTTDPVVAERAVARAEGALAWRNDRLVWTWSSEDKDGQARNVAKMFRFLRSVA